jgi:hypothetical protein
MNSFDRSKGKILMKMTRHMQKGIASTKELKMPKE